MSDDSIEVSRPLDDEALWRLAAALGESISIERVGETLAEHAGVAAGGVFANVAFRPGESGQIQVIHRSVLDPDPAGLLVVDLDDHLPVCESIRSGLPVLLGSPEEIARRFPSIVAEVEAAGIRSRASVPVHSARGEVLGAIGFGWQEPQEFGVLQLRRLDLIAQLAGLAIDRALHDVYETITERDLTEALDTMPNAFFSLDRDFRITHVNSEGARLLRSSREVLTGSNLFDFPEATGSDFERGYRQSMETGQPTVTEGFYGPLDAWFEVHVEPSHHGLNVYFINITERRNAEIQNSAELASAENANRRLRLLTGLAAQLAGSEGRDELYQRLTQVLVPAMADWCTIVVPKGEELERVAARHREPGLDALAKRLVGTYPHAFSGPSPGVVVYRSAQPLRMGHLVGEIVEDLDDSVASAAYGRTLDLLGDGPGLIVPVLLGDDVEAVLTMIRSSGDPFTDADVAAMVEMATYIGGALEAADDRQAQRETARALQAAALPTSLPSTERLVLAATYREASGAAQVGGDWYDALELDGGRIALVVGDVAGHGIAAASLTAQLRNALRAHLFAGAGPLDSLVQLSRLVATQEPDALATVICVEVELENGQLTWASAGHPAPILVSTDGTSAHLRGSPIPPIGCGGPHLTGLTSDAAQHRITLRPGSRLLLFTDGLIERRTSILDVGLAHLMIVAEQTYQEPDPSVVCDAIVRSMLTDSHDDDVCLLVADWRS